MPLGGCLVSLAGVQRWYGHRENLSQGKDLFFR
jgi:hypothetical protein